MIKKAFPVYALLLILLIGCDKPKPELVLEVTTFNLKTTASQKAFNALDAEVESNFTSKQPGFIKRESARDEKGNYVVLVYWNTTADAEASMEKFMADPSVADYAGMIEGPSMKMNRYSIKQNPPAQASSFVEVMEFNTLADADAEAFNAVNQKVADEVTAPKEGFVDRITGENSDGEQVVVVYWDNKANSDAALQPFMENPLSKEFMGMMEPSSIQMVRTETLPSVQDNLTNKDKVVALLNTFNTGDQGPIAYINPQKYIQHNLDVADGLAGFGAVMQNAPEGGFKAQVVRAFQDGDYVFTHTEYDFFGPKAAFDVFRFEDGLIVEHWDNLIAVQPANPSGHTQFDGSTTLLDLDKTEANKAKVKAFIETVLLGGAMDQVTNYINPENYVQHNPAVADGLEGFGAAMQYFAENGLVMEYKTLHKVMGQGNFVLALSEGKFGKGEPTAFYDLFRLENGLIVEHWDVIATIPPKAQWKNDNGKF